MPAARKTGNVFHTDVEQIVAKDQLHHVLVILIVSHSISVGHNLPIRWGEGIRCIKNVLRWFHLIIFVARMNKGIVRRGAFVGGLRGIGCVWNCILLRMGRLLRILGFVRGGI